MYRQTNRKDRRMLTNELTVLYITRYRVELVYGGPEEGGWWYDWRDYEGIDRKSVV